MNGAKNYGIVEGKVLEYTRESTRGEVAYKGGGRSVGGTGRSNMVAPMEIFLTVVSNTYLIPKSIFIHYET